MASKRRRPRGKKRAKGRRGYWFALVLLLVAAAGLGGYLYRQLPGVVPSGRRAPDPRASVEAVVGRLEPSGIRLRAADRRAGEALLAKIAGALPADGTGEAKLASERNGNAIRAALTLDGWRYPIEITWPEAAPVPPPPPRLAVVIDDMGRDLHAARVLLDLEVPVTLSILPHLPESRAVAALAGERGRECLLHLPMEPRGYPKADPGKYALMASMGEARIRQLVRENLAAVPGVAGVNNHMGSRLTEMPEPMAWVMEELSGRGLYFLDSLTSGRSVAAEEARAAGLSWARRDVFIDNVQDAEAIGRQLDKAVARARSAGHAIAIGHPHPATLDALREWARRVRESDVRVVPLGDLVRRGGDGA